MNGKILFSEFLICSIFKCILLTHAVFMCLLIKALKLDISVLVRTTEGTKLYVLMTLSINLHIHKCMLKTTTLTELKIWFSYVVDYSSEYMCLGLAWDFPIQVPACTK